MPINNDNTFCPSSREEWRQWLEENHMEEESVWLVQYKVKSKKTSIPWSDAVEEALCFGWIDSVRRTIDDESYKQYFCKRKPKSTWSKINKEKVEQLTSQGLMADAGLLTIEIAKKNGSWTILDGVEALIVPTDLEQAFDKQPNSKEYYLSLSKSIQKMLLAWVVLAKRPETRQKRIDEIASQAAQQKLPKHIR
ncbi:MAG: YdeI/OmpD-associated family protein [Candidatus Kapaibacterium sp.]